MSRFTTVFLDRDGTLNVKAADGEYVSRPRDVELLRGVAEGVRRLNDARLFVVVVSNQRGVARGRMTEGDLWAVDDQLAVLLSAGGAHLDRSYYCIHEEGECDCRKPAPGLLLRAAAENPEIDLSAAVLVGDAESDVEAAIAAGVTALRLAAADVPTRADVLCADFASAVDWILRAAQPVRG